MLWKTWEIIFPNESLKWVGFESRLLPMKDQRNAKGLYLDPDHTDVIDLLIRSLPFLKGLLQDLLLAIH